MTGVVALNRHFIDWTSKDSGDPAISSYLSTSLGALSWNDLLQRHRVVILAEPGSGKSTEIDEQVRRSTAAGRHTFATTVQSIGRRGLVGALGSAARKLSEWRQSDQPAWFFIDSVDEAKADNIPLDAVLRELADGIDGARARAHIILTGRNTDWEYVRDLERLTQWLSMPPPDTSPGSIDPNDLVVSVIRRESKNEKQPVADQPLVVLMAPLDREQVSRFAEGKGVSNIADFVEALDSGDLWSFAKRPLDLGWLVEYWRTHDLFDSLAKMLELSLVERLREVDPDRERRNPIDANRALQALERTGAALVLQRLRDIEVPDSGLSLDDQRPSLDLADVLPDWSGEDRARLISRAAFEPASAGFVRLHNDNNGVVRAYLAAAWFKRLLDANCPRMEIHDLLFATTYGRSCVIPSMREAAAWLSIISSETCEEIIRRDPRLLMDAGDPASQSIEVRERALETLVEGIVNNPEFDIPSHDSVKRFASEDIAACVKECWEKHSESPAVRELLLLLVWLGPIKDCADVTISACFGAYPDRYTQLFSGRALMAVAMDTDKQRYAEFVLDHIDELRPGVVWDAVNGLFPNALTVSDLLGILTKVDDKDEEYDLGFDYHGPGLVDQLSSRNDVNAMLVGVLDLLDSRAPPEDDVNSKKDEEYLSTIEAAGRRLLQLSADTDTPDAAVDAAIRVGAERRYQTTRSMKGDATDLISLLRQTKERRREALWKAVLRLRGDPRLYGRELTDTWDLERLGFRLGLQPEDFDWLLVDAAERTQSDERKVAVNATLRLWRDGGKSPEQLVELKSVGERVTEVATAVADWTQPREMSAKELEFHAESEQHEKQHALEAAQRDQSWRDFADKIRSDPDQLRDIKAPTEEGVDARLYHLWQVLRDVGENRSRYAVDDLSPLAPMFGEPVVEALREAFIVYWRRWNPTLPTERPVDKRNRVTTLDLIGIVGVTLEAASTADWATGLSHEDAIKAAIYATIELNGFPVWFTPLAAAQPEAVQEVLMRAVTSELEEQNEDARCDVLIDIARTENAVTKVIAGNLYESLKVEDKMPIGALKPVVKILVSGYQNKGELADLFESRFMTANDFELESTCLAGLYAIDSPRALVALEEKVGTLQEDDQPKLVQSTLSTLFGRWGDRSIEASAVPVKLLTRLVCLAYRTIRVEDDHDRAGRGAYTPDARDNAEQAREMIFKALVETPGPATFDAINSLIGIADIPISPRRLREIAAQRAAEDSEFEAWTSADVNAFETEFLTAPRNTRDLQRLAVRRLLELQHDLVHSDFAEAKIVASLDDETAVQNWVAGRLRQFQGRSYSIERESHVVDEKEPDIRFRAKESDASIPMEIKIAENWTLPNLEEALQSQLIGQYLRDRETRHGILLLVHQERRSRGWKAVSGAWLNFEELVDHLRGVASSIAAKDFDSPQVEVAVIDVSTVT